MANIVTGVQIPVAGGLILRGDLTIPHGASLLVVFAHGSGSSRRSSRNKYVAECLNAAGFGTLLFDLLSEAEALQDQDQNGGPCRFDVSLLADRLGAAIKWLQSKPTTRNLRYGLFGASTGSAAALVCAARTRAVTVLVSRGGRPDLAGGALLRVTCPVLLLVGGNDREVLKLNRSAQKQLRCKSELAIIAHATHLFEEEGALQQVAERSIVWFDQGAPQAVPRSYQPYVNADSIIKFNCL